MLLHNSPFPFSVNFDFATDNLLTGGYEPNNNTFPGTDLFMLLDNSEFLLLDTTNFLLLGS